MIIGIVEALYIDGYRIRVKFDDGVTKTADLSSYLDGEIFQPLKDLEYFSHVRVDEEIETITWANGADFAPDFLYKIGEETIVKKS